MPSQYDQIGKRYASIVDMPADSLNVLSVLAVLPDVAGLSCLDLACGLGRYSRLLLDKGAGKVVGIDISEGMINEARDIATSLSADHQARLEFRIADCSEPVHVDGGPFDLVFAAWFLNYAPNYESMLSMWQNIHTNLKPGGQFVSVVPRLDLNMDTPLDYRYGITVKAIGTVEDGWKCRLTANTEPVLEFDMYQLRQDVYEKCAAEAGMLDFKLHSHVLPEDERKYNGFWDVYNERPHINILTARRPD